jgi:hypothetical protein
MTGATVEGGRSARAHDPNATTVIDDARSYPFAVVC